MSFDWEDILEKLATDNEDVDEILEALDNNWNVAERLHKINDNSMKQVVFDNMSMEEVVDRTINEDSVEAVLDYIKTRYSDEFKQFIEEDKE